MIDLNQRNDLGDVPYLLSKNSSLIGETGAFHTNEPKEVISFSGFYFDTADNLWLNLNVNNGTVTHYPNARSFRLNIGNGATDQITRQTNRVFPYFAGNEQSLHFGAAWNLQDGAKAEIGYGDDNNGMFYIIEKTAGQYSMSLLLRSSATGSLVETLVPRSQWNIDKLDGAGVSGITLDPNVGHMLAIAWTWYGYGSAVWMIKIDGLLRPVHRISAGNSSFQPILGEPNQPIRYNIWNTQATAGNSYLQVSGINLRENGSSPDQRKGFTRTTPITLTKNVSASNTYVLASLRPKITYKTRNNRGVIQLRNYWLSGTSNGTFALVFNPTLTGASWADVDINSSFCEYDSTASAYTGGVILDSGGLSSNRGDNISQAPDTRDPIAPLSDFSGTNHVSLVFRCTANGSIDFGFNWVEFI